MNTISKNNSKGFTIVELLIVIVVIAILSVITIVAYNGLQTQAHNSRTVAMTRGMVSALESYKVVNGTYPGAFGVPSCIGVGYTNNACGTMKTSSECTALGVTPIDSQVTSQSSFIDPLKAFLKSDIPAITTSNLTYSFTFEGGCVLSNTMTGSTYNTGCVIFMTPLGQPLLGDNGCGVPNAYMIEYAMRGTDADCTLPNSTSRNALFDISVANLNGWKICTVYDGPIFKIE